MPVSDAAYESLMQFLYRAPIGLLEITREGGIEMMNPMAANLLMPLSQDGGLDNLFTLLQQVAPQLRQMAAAVVLPGGVVCEGLRIPLHAAAGDSAAPQVLSFSLLNVDDVRLMAAIHDATHDVQREEAGLARRLGDAARIDTLTCMPNRMVMLERLRAAMLRADADPGYDFALLYMNCDRLKLINDALGRAVGDELLKLLADRLRATLLAQERVGQTDGSVGADGSAWATPATRGGVPLAARIGGDEFVVLVEDVQPSDDVCVLAQGLVDALTTPYGIGAHKVFCGVSMGIVPCDRATGDADAVLQDASLAMEEAKLAGGARYVLFHQTMRLRATQRAGLEADLRKALTEQQLFVVYQPVVGLQGERRTDGAVDRSAGVEALVRWRHPTRGVVPPIEFIGVAEECGLIQAVGEFVLATACRQFVQWQAELGPRAPRHLAVNLSRGQLGQPGLVDMVAGILLASGMTAGQLQLEVTESLAAQGEAALARLHELKALGLTLALDDFGTGYSSLASLHQIPVDTVKIDRSFVSQADTSLHHRVLIDATIRVAHSLGMNTVAEGIETAAQARVIRELGSDKGQGYLFSKPLMSEDLVRWVIAEGLPVAGSTARPGPAVTDALMKTAVQRPPGTPG